MKTAIEPITEERLRYVLRRLSPEDAAELSAAGLDGNSFRVFEYGWRCATESGCIEFDGEPVAVFGAGPTDDDPKVAVVWMVATSRFTERPQAMARLSRKVVSGWRQRFRLLTNLVHRDHTRAINWLRWLGFSVSDVGVGPRRAFFAFSVGGANV